MQVSPDNVNYTNVGSAVTALTPAGYTTVTIPASSLTAFVGQSVRFRVLATYSSGSQLSLSLDNWKVLTPCVAPNTPTNLTTGSSSPGQITGSYTASNADQYLVVRYPAGSQVTAPVNGTSYAAGATLGLGRVAHVLTTNSFTTNGLSPNTSYDYYVYPVAVTTCYGGPVYGTPATATQTTAGCPTLNSLITVGASGADYTSLTNLAPVINGCPVSAPTIIQLNSDYNPAGETFPIQFINNTGASATNTITLQPASDVSSGFTLSGSSSTSMINLSGARYWIIDGRPGGAGNTSMITVRNTGTGAAVLINNGSSFNTLQYLNLQAQPTSNTSGVVNINTGVTAGNDNNTITANVIDARGIAPNAIYAVGSAAPNDNKSNTISNNSIINYYSDVAGIRNAGIQLGTNNGVSTNGAWTITGNSFYQTSSRAYTQAVPVHAVNADGATSGVFNITNNYVGGTAAQAGGSALTYTGTGFTFPAFRLFLATSATSNLTGNTIRNISITTTSTSTLNYGFGIGTGQVVASGNTIGSTSTPGSITYGGGAAGGFIGIIALNVTGGAATNISITNNTIAGLTVTGSNANALYGINTSSATTLSGQGAISQNRRYR